MAQAAKLVVLYRSIDKLKPYSKNARTHSKRQIRQIAKSIKSFGFLQPILIDATGTIVAGHGRVAGAKLLGLSEVPTICIEGLSQDQIRAYILADNQIALNAGWDRDILAIELQHLLSIDSAIDITVTGFEIAEIDLIIGGASPAPDIADAVEPIPEFPVSRRGDLWLLGLHRVLCSNSLDEQTYSDLLDGRMADLIYTDPPYNIAIDGNVSGKGTVKHSNFAMATGEMSAAEFTQFLEVTLGHLARHSTSGSVHFVCMDWRHMNEILAAGGRVYDTLLNLCVWAKDNGGQGSFYRSQHELVFVFRNGKGKHRNNIQLGRFGRYRTNVWQYPGVRGLSQQQGGEGNLLALHPTVKPVALVADAILDCSAPGDLVLDGFLGSGSTLIAAERVRRTCYGIELEPRYVDTAVRRWQTYTGENAVHAITGQTFGQLAVERSHHG